MPRTEATFSGVVTVDSAASTEIRPANVAREEIVVVNDGSNIVYLQLQTDSGTDPVAVVGEGVRINASGGSWSSNVFKGAVHGIADTADTDVTVVEI